MQHTGTISIEALIHSASNAAAALKQVTSGKASDEPASTNIETLQQISELMERMAGELGQRRKAGDRMTGALERIAALKVREASELIAQGKWKTLAEEFQSIAQNALDPETEAAR